MDQEGNKKSIPKYELEKKDPVLNPETIFRGRLIDQTDLRANEEYVFFELGRGSSKIVLVLESPIEENLKKKNIVYCIALHGMKKALLADIKIRLDIQKCLENIGVNIEESCLDIEFKNSDYIINDKETFEFERADTNLKLQLKNNLYPLTFLQNLEMILKIITAVYSLHRVNYVHGDLKLDNLFLYFSKQNLHSSNVSDKNLELRVKLSDFHETVSAISSHRIKYNNRMYMSPEGNKSKQAEVFSLGMLMIRVLENEFLIGDRLFLIRPEEFQEIFKEGVDEPGVGFFMLVITERNLAVQKKLHDLYVVDEFTGQINKKFLYEQVCRSSVIPENQIAKVVQQLWKYIDELKKNLNNKYPLMQDEIEKICQLIKDMTVATPSVRLKTKDILEEYKKIFDLFQNKL